MSGRALARGDRVELRRLGPRDRDAFLAAVRRSRRLHHPWSHPPETPEAFDAYVARSAARRTLGVFRSEDDALAGVVALSQIFFGRFRGAYLGYFAFTPLAGKGYMREAIGLVAGYGFGTLGLHRIQASVQPGNARSIALIRACGFRLEGASPRYLHIADDWRDHETWVLHADGPLEAEVLAAGGPVTLHRVTSANWREVVSVRARRDQRRWVADVAGYLTMCRYEGGWSPLAIAAHGRVVGFAMWCQDPDDLGSYWIGGFTIDARRQSEGFGRAALEALVAHLRGMPGCRDVALSYRPENLAARRLYAHAGFVETGESVDDELVARLPVRAGRSRVAGPRSPVRKV